MRETTNYERAHAAARAVHAYSTHTRCQGNGARSALRDLLCDLYHLCDRMGLDMDGLVASARKTYEEERDEEARDFAVACGEPSGRV